MLGLAKASQNIFVQLPKVELHAHLNGSIRDATILDLACQIDGQDSAAKDILEADRSLSKVFQIFGLITKLTDSIEAITRIAREVVEDFALENVKYLELRTTPKASKTKGFSKHEYVQAVLSGIKEAQVAGTDIQTNLLLSIDRRLSSAEALDTVKLALEFSSCGVVGIDLSGDPSQGTFESFTEALSLAREGGLKLALHFAEVYNAAESIAMLQSKPDRIGHANSLDDNLFKALLANPVPLEVCPTSNILTGSVASYADHHFGDFWKAHYPLAICTDDKGVFATSLSREYALIAESFSLGIEDLLQLSLAPIQYTFADAATKESLRQRFIALHESLLHSL